MAVLAGSLRVQGATRSAEPLQVSGTMRAGPLTACSWSFVAPATITSGSDVWTIPARTPAQLPDGTTALDLSAHAYVIYARPGDTGLYGVAQEHFAATAAVSAVVALAWVDAHHDLTPLVGSGPSWPGYLLLAGAMDDGAYGRGGPDADDMPYPPSGGVGNRAYLAMPPGALLPYPQPGEPAWTGQRLAAANIQADPCYSWGYTTGRIAIQDHGLGQLLRFGPYFGGTVAFTYHDPLGTGDFTTTPILYTAEAAASTFAGSLQAALAALPPLVPPVRVEVTNAGSPGPNEYNYHVNIIGVPPYDDLTPSWGGGGGSVGIQGVPGALAAPHALAIADDNTLWYLDAPASPPGVQVTLPRYYTDADVPAGQTMIVRCLGVGCNAFTWWILVDEQSVQQLADGAWYAGKHTVNTWSSRKTAPTAATDWTRAGGYNGLGFPGRYPGSIRDLAPGATPPSSSGLLACSYTAEYLTHGIYYDGSVPTPWPRNAVARCSDVQLLISEAPLYQLICTFETGTIGNTWPLELLYTPPGGGTALSTGALATGMDLTINENAALIQNALETVSGGSVHVIFQANAHASWPLAVGGAEGRELANTFFNVAIDVPGGFSLALGPATDLGNWGLPPSPGPQNFLLASCGPVLMHDSTVSEGASETLLLAPECGTLCLLPDGTLTMYSSDWLDQPAMVPPPQAGTPDPTLASGVALVSVVRIDAGYLDSSPASTLTGHRLAIAFEPQTYGIDGYGDILYGWFGYVAGWCGFRWAPPADGTGGLVPWMVPVLVNWYSGNEGDDVQWGQPGTLGHAGTLAPARLPSIDPGGVAVLYDPGGVGPAGFPPEYNPPTSPSYQLIGSYDGSVDTCRNWVAGCLEVWNPNAVHYVYAIDDTGALWYRQQESTGAGAPTGTFSITYTDSGGNQWTTADITYVNDVLAMPLAVRTALDQLPPLHGHVLLGILSAVMGVVAIVDLPLSGPLSTNQAGMSGILGFSWWTKLHPAFIPADHLVLAFAQPSSGLACVHGKDDVVYVTTLDGNDPAGSVGFSTHVELDTHGINRFSTGALSMALRQPPS